MLWPVAIELDGELLQLEDVQADLVIHHGRIDVGDDPTSSSAQVTLSGVTKDFVKPFRVGVELVVRVADTDPPTPRFSGRVTDASLDVDVLTAIAVGRLSTLDAYTIGAVNWPAETWSARVTRCFTEAGLAAALELQPDPAFNPLLVARDTTTAGTTRLADYLAFLAPMVGAAVTDKPDGGLLVQALGARRLEDALPLDPALIAYAPPWLQVLPGANIVTVRYTGDQSQSVTVREDSSVAIYGERPATIDTTFQNVADATYRANLRLVRSAFPHWNMPAAPALAGLELEVGLPVELSQLPPSSPADPWTPIVEGWTDTITGPDWAMELALSDPLASGLVLPWISVPPSYLWNTINPATAWADALTLEDLTPAR